MHTQTNAQTDKQTDTRTDTQIDTRIDRPTQIWTLTKILTRTRSGREKVRDMYMYSHRL